MMLILRDDRVIEIFDSPDQPPNWIETIDVENNEYQFCDDTGQKYIGVINKIGWFAALFRPETFTLQPQGKPELSNALSLIDRAVLLEKNGKINDLPALRQYVLTKNSSTK